MDEQLSKTAVLKQELEKAGIFSPNDLHLNQAGSLSNNQKQFFSCEIYFWFGLIGLESIVFFSSWAFFLKVREVSIASFLWSLFLLISISFCWKHLNPLRLDLIAGHVKSIGGEVHKRSQSSVSGKGPSPSYWVISIGNLAFDVKPAIFNAIIEHRAYRIYYLPHSRKLVNIEPF